MIWIILFFIIILVSAVLAFRSMKDYEEFPDSVGLNSLFYIGNPSAFSEGLLDRLHGVFSEKKQFFSLEKLNKGSEAALAIFGPAEMEDLFPELKLVEIEDYLGEAGSELLAVSKAVTVNQSLTWLIDPKSSFKNPEHDLKIEIKENQKLFLQAVCVPEINAKTGFQCTLRLMAVDPNPVDRLGLAKKAAEIFEQSFGLKKLVDSYPEQKKFSSYQQRSLIPKEVSPFQLNTKDLAELFLIS